MEYTSQSSSSDSSSYSKSSSSNSNSHVSKTQSRTSLDSYFKFNYADYNSVMALLIDIYFRNIRLNMNEMQTQKCASLSEYVREEFKKVHGRTFEEDDKKVFETDQTKQAIFNIIENQIFNFNGNDPSKKEL